MSYGGQVPVCQVGRLGTGLEKILTKIKEYIKENLILTLAAQLFVAPILLIHFNTISLTFFISNILAGVLIGPITILGFLLIFLSFLSIKLASFFAIFLNFLLDTLKLIAKISSNIPFSNIYVVSIPFVFIIIYYLALLLINLYKKISLKENKRVTELKFINRLRTINWKTIIVIFFLVITVFNLIQSITRKFTIHFIDVGQGDSCLIVTDTNKKVLIDGGGSEFGTFDVGERILLPYILNRGIKTLDYVIITHFDTDHCARSINSYGGAKCKSCNYIKTRRGFRKLSAIFEDSKRKKYKSKSS